MKPSACLARLSPSEKNYLGAYNGGHSGNVGDTEHYLNLCLK